MEVFLAFLPLILIIGLPFLWWSLTALSSLVVDPIKEKRLLLEKEESSQAEKYKALCEETAKLKEEAEKIKEEAKAESDRLISNAVEEAERIRDQAQKAATEKVTATLKYSTGLGEQTRVISNVIQSTFREKYHIESFFDTVTTKRLCVALNTDIELFDIDFSADIRSGDHMYSGVTLRYCPCKDFELHHKPCKHIVFLAYSLGVLQTAPKEYKSALDTAIDKFEAIRVEYQTLEAGIKRDKERRKNINLEIKSSEKSLEELRQAADAIVREKCSGYPQLAGVMADLHTLYYERSAQYLLQKTRPALTEARRIQELRADTRKILAEKKEIEYKLAYIQKLFPNIDDIFDNEFEPSPSFELETDDNADRTRSYLSHDEYRSLSRTERNQLALDRYIASNKSKWQIGRDYEMYVGYLCQTRGYRVAYTGIIQKFEDMGRDLIASNTKETLIIQCKNWSKEKTIHEKHIFQLFGTLVEYRLAHESEKCKGVFVTTTTLSDTAKKVAHLLEITIIESLPLADFPRIKCNIGRTGEKIYHLPFDQQYDNAVIETNKGEFMAFTVKEAEEQGFRRAFKHLSA